MSGRSFSESLNNVYYILKKDFKDATKNPIVMITLFAIILLPSLYALLNIQACWDPYENTGNLEFAIANVDGGASYDGEKLNVGNELEKELKKNDKFNWTFVDEKTLREGVKNGTYYSGIIIPKNFSENIVSITSDNPHSGELEYVVNRKANPMASKLSDSAAREVYNKMNAKIVEFIDLAAYGKLGDLQSALASGAGQLSSGAVQLQSGSSQVASGASQVSSGASQVKSGASDLSSASSQVSSGASQVKSGASKVNSGSSQVQSGASQIQSSANQVSSGASQVQQSASQISSSVDVDKLPSDQLKQVVNGSVKLANASSDLAGASSNLAQGSAKLANSSSQVAKGASGVADGASSVADGASSLASGANKLSNGTSELADGALSLAAGSELLANSAVYALFTASSSLSSASNSLADVTGVDESEVGEYIYSPVKLNETELYPVSNYASEVAPFYVVLSMWVGALITCVMLRIGQSTGTKFYPTELYFGKLLIFLVMAFLQTTVTLIGLFALGVDIHNVGLYVFSAYLISLIFMLISYSFISALGQVGKAIIVILLVLQISGTGGIYPIGLMDSFFQSLYPYMPMTHAITMLRESSLGLLWSNYIPAFLILCGIAIATLVLSVIVKMYADKGSHWFEEKLNETELF